MNKRGITLIELVVVMVIIAVAAVLTIPNIGAWFLHYRLRTGTRDVVSLMRVAQMKAVSDNTSYRVLFLANEGSYVLQRTTDGLNWSDEGAAQRLPKGIRFLADSNAQFNPDATASGGITLNDQRKYETRITLLPSTGRVRVE